MSEVRVRSIWFTLANLARFLFWLLLLGSLGDAFTRRFCGEGIWGVPCVLLVVALAYALPPVLGVAGGLLVWMKLKQKPGK